MSGARQHFIPRFLQKGFRIPSNGKIVRCWVYEQSKSPRSANIQNVGVERYFYAIDNEPDLDDKITDEESDVYAPLVENLRAGNLTESVVERIPALLAHLEIRSRHVRHNMQSFVDDSVSGILEHLSEPENLRALAKNHFRPGSPLFDKALVDQGISHEQVQTLLAMGESALEQIFQPFVAIVAAQMPAQLDRIKSLIPDVIRGSHVRILNESVSPAARARRFNALHYSVQTFAAGDLPLGDSVVLFNVRGERAFKPFVDKGDELVHVILPLSSDMYLLGATNDPKSSPPQNLPLEIARCSIEYFICAHQRDDAADLQAQIGINARWLSAREMNSIINEVLSESMSEKLA